MTEYCQNHSNISIEKKDMQVKSAVQMFLFANELLSILSNQDLVTEIALFSNYWNVFLEDLHSCYK